MKNILHSVPSIAHSKFSPGVMREKGGRCSNWLECVTPPPLRWDEVHMDTSFLPKEGRKEINYVTSRMEFRNLSVYQLPII